MSKIILNNHISTIFNFLAYKNLFSETNKFDKIYNNYFTQFSFCLIKKVLSDKNLHSKF